MSTPSAARAPIALMIDSAPPTGRPHRISSGPWHVSHMPMLYAHGGALRSARLPETAQPDSPTVAATQVRRRTSPGAGPAEDFRCSGDSVRVLRGERRFGRFMPDPLRRGSDIPADDRKPLVRSVIRSL